MYCSGIFIISSVLNILSCKYKTVFQLFHGTEYCYFFIGRIVSMIQIITGGLQQYLRFQKFLLWKSSWYTETTVLDMLWYQKSIQYNGTSGASLQAVFLWYTKKNSSVVDWKLFRTDFNKVGVRQAQWSVLYYFKFL